MKSLTIKDWLTILGFAITFGGWIATYSKMEADVENLKAKMDKYDIAVMANELNHLTEQSRKNGDKLDKIYEMLLGGD